MPGPVGSLLWRRLRIYQVYGANTDVGKTIFTTVLCKAASRLWKQEHVAFLKPVSAGMREEADDRHVETYAPSLDTETLFHYDLAASPHLAARVTKQKPPSDEYLLSRVSHYASLRAARGPGWLLVETAGGVHSPGPSGTTQADLYRPLRLPVILVGDSKLGGISQTISAFESLKSRGYDIETVLLFHDAQYRNAEYLKSYLHQHHDIPVVAIAEPPERNSDPALDRGSMSQYYENVSSQQEASEILGHLDDRHQKRLARLESMRGDAHKRIWYPFTQHKNITPEGISVIDSAHGDYFQTLAPESTAAASVLEPSFDGSASWWTQGLGHGNPSLALAAAYAAGRYGHVMFPEAVHEPALALAEKLLSSLGNPRLSRVFFSDNGSTGVEVAIKMAMRATRLAYGLGTGGGKLGVIGLRGSYHGDTIGAMDCAEPGIFNEKVEWYDGKGFWFSVPTVKCIAGKWTVQVPPEFGSYPIEGTEFASLADVFDFTARDESGSRASAHYEKYITETLVNLQAQGRRFGALILEPVVLGAGGMLLVDPLFQRTLVNVVRHSPHLFYTSSPATSGVTEDEVGWTGLPVIFDEVFTGIYRLGRFTASSFLGVHADISVHAKLLTGGVLPLCTTLASESIFKAFASDEKSDALLHGHSYTAHAVGCQVALETLRELRQMDERGDWNWAKSIGGWTPSLSAKSENQEVNNSTPNRTTDTALVWSVWTRAFVESLSRQTSAVDGVWAIGTVLAIHMLDADSSGYKSNAARKLQCALYQGEDSEELHHWNVHSRVLGNVLYLMASQKTTKEGVSRIEDLLRAALGC